MKIISLYTLTSNIYRHVTKFMPICIRYSVKFKIVKIGSLIPAEKSKETFYSLHWDRELLTSDKWCQHGIF
jgi:hypothetical protein